MGTIQNQFNQILAASFGAALAGERASVGMKELKAAGLRETQARKEIQYMTEHVGKAKTELKDVDTLEKLADFEDEYSMAEQQAVAADVAETEAIEGKRQAELRYGTKRQREIAAEQAGDYEQNMLLAKQGYGLDEAVSAKRTALEKSKADAEEALRVALEKKQAQQSLIEERRKVLTANVPQSYPVRETENYGRI